MQKFLHRLKIFKKVQSEGFWLSQIENHVICCISKNNQQCGLLFWNTWISTKNIIGCLEIRFHSYLLNLHDLHMWFEYLHIIKGIDVRFHSYLLNRHDLHMQSNVSLKILSKVIQKFELFLKFFEIFWNFFAWSILGGSNSCL